MKINEFCFVSEQRTKIDLFDDRVFRLTKMYKIIEQYSHAMSFI